MPSSRPTPRPGSPGSARPRRSTGNTRPVQRTGQTRPRPPQAARARPRFTRRMAILTVVAAVLVVSYASSMRAHLEQKGHISDLHSEIAASQKDITALGREKARWADKQYVASQARARFGWVLPGEIAYQVIGKDGKPLGGGDQLSDPNDIVHVTPTPWWSKEYDSLQKADHPPKAPEPPANRITPSAE